MSKSLTTTELLREAGLPTNRRPSTPGEVIREEFLKPMGITQTELANSLRIPLQRLNLILNGKRGVTPDSALRLSRFFGTSVRFWLNLQQAVDLFDAITTTSREELGKVRRRRRAG
jgi:antitoxin HigA-1